MFDLFCALLAIGFIVWLIRGVLFGFAVFLFMIGVHNDDNATDSRLYEVLHFLTPSKWDWEGACPTSNDPISLTRRLIKKYGHPSITPDDDYDFTFGTAEARRPTEDTVQPQPDPASPKETSAVDFGLPWYVVLQCAANAPKSEIRRLYHKLIAQYHPDKVAGLGAELQALAEAKTKQITLAYQESRARPAH